MLLIPVGSTENHGPSAPYGEDTYLDTRLCELVAERTGCTVAQPIWYGSHPYHHLGQKGTIMIPEKILADYIAGQASDGWGESVEQRDIEVDDGVLNVHLWNSSQKWTIQEEERFSQDFHTQLPDLCWSVRLGEGELIYIKKGESGYKRSKMSTKDKAQNRYLADYNNRRRGITRAQEQAMLTGCLHGWDVPMADPVVQEKVLGAKSSLEMKGL